MKVQIQIETKPGINAAGGTAQRLIEQAAIRVGVGDKDGEIKGDFGTVKFTVTPDEPPKKK